jgi:hypothetical protein
MRLICSMLTAGLLAVALAACGGGGQGSDERAAARTLTSWLAEMAAGDDRAACERLTAHLQDLIDLQLRQHSVHETCRTYAARWASPFRVPGHRDATVKSVRISGTTATAVLSAPPNLQSEARLRKVRGQWKVENY